MTQFRWLPGEAGSDFDLCGEIGIICLSSLDWVDITRYFLEKKDGKYYPCYGEYESDIRKLNPMLEIIYKSIFEFFEYIDGHGIDEGIREELAEDLRVIRELDSMHFNYIRRLED